MTTDQGPQDPDSTTLDREVLDIVDVTKIYATGGSWFRRGPQLTALGGVNLQLRKGEILALVGESGSGKSTLAKILVGSEKPTSGHLQWATSSESERTHRARRVQMVFQDPYSSLNPRMTVRAMLSELLQLHHIVAKHEVADECRRLLNRVGLESDALDAYPSQFSGGQRQRIAIARALAVRPEVLIADEPVSALDVSVQATILDLFSELQRDLGLSILFVAHNLAVVQHLSQRVAVMYLGRIVEVATTAELFSNPRHPYTRALIQSIPRMDPDHRISASAVEGEPPSPFDIPTGCRFHPRCPFADDDCRGTDPTSQSISPTHETACLHASTLPQFTAEMEESA